MKFYRNHYRLEDDESIGHQYFTSRQEAEKAWNEMNKTIPLRQKRVWIQNGDRAQSIEFQNTQMGILKMLNAYANHPDNG
tara:strand:+ start:1298 stop:1537 length:240 start_codon:yes stop_codon:yes gene_type:complete